MIRELARKYIDAVRATAAAVDAEFRARMELAAAFRAEVASRAAAPCFVRVGGGLCVYFTYPDQITYGVEPRELPEGVR